MDQHKELEKEGGTMDQHKKQEQEGEPTATDQRKEEEQAGKPEEPTDQRREEEEAGKSEELTDQRKVEVEAVAEVDTSEELTDQRKAAAEEDKDKETERSSDEVSVEASSVFVHPCSRLLRYLVRAYAWCMGMADWFGGGTRPSAAPAASINSSREEPGEAADMRTREISKTTTDRGFYMREVIMRVRAVRRPRPPGNPREGRGGGGGSHN